jgi:predicted RNase H-like nuclease (RuvC/YqgF family)
MTAFESYTSSENTINSQKIDDQDVTIQSKNETIKHLKQSEATLKHENKIIKEEIEKLKRIASKMHKELKESEAKRC